jgi:hypothetical protein
VTLLLEMLARARRCLQSQSRARRELMIFGIALLVGLIGVPPLIWVAGTRILGPYTRGTEVHDSPLALMADYFAGLAHGSLIFWAVALGPAAFLLAARVILRAVVRRPPPTEAD